MRGKRPRERGKDCEHEERHRERRKDCEEGGETPQARGKATERMGRRLQEKERGTARAWERNCESIGKRMSYNGTGRERKGERE